MVSSPRLLKYAPVIPNSQDLSLEEGGGSLCVLGRSPFSKEKLSNQELRQVAWYGWYDDG